MKSVEYLEGITLRVGAGWASAAPLVEVQHSMTIALDRGGAPRVVRAADQMSEAEAAAVERTRAALPRLLRTLRIVETGLPVGDREDLYLSVPATVEDLELVLGSEDGS